MNVAWKTPWGDAKSPYQLTGTVQADSGKKYAYTLRVTRAEDGTDDSDEQKGVIRTELQRWLDSDQSK